MTDDEHFFGFCLIARENGNNLTALAVIRHFVRAIRGVWLTNRVANAETSFVCLITPGRPSESKFTYFRRRRAPFCSPKTTRPTCSPVFSNVTPINARNGNCDATATGRNVSRVITRIIRVKNARLPDGLVIPTYYVGRVPIQDRRAYMQRRPNSSRRSRGGTLMASASVACNYRADSMAD